MMHQVGPRGSTGLTHVIVADPSKRTMKILFGLARNAWIVSEMWVFASANARQWLREEDFALPPYLPQVCRIS